MKRVLVIDDNEEIRFITATYLKTRDFETIEAENGLLGLELARLYLPDLILCDIAMPHLDGFEVLTQLSNDPVTTAIPFIFLSAHSDRANFRHGMELGADDFLSKPFSGTELIQAVETRLARQQSLTHAYSKRLGQIEQQAEYLKYHDLLTGLPNQLFLFDYLDNVLAEPGTPKLALLHLRVNCQRVNESLGRDFGDHFLKLLSKRLVSCLSEINHLLSRLPSGRFVIALFGLNSKAAVAKIARLILAELSTPFSLDNSEVFANANLGLAIYPDDGKERQRLLRSAEQALAQSVKSGNLTYRFYAKDLHSRETGLLSLEAELSHALERQELQVYYQPQVEVQTGRLVGMEALLRWQHPQRGLISPTKFIPMAEELGLIHSIGEWALQTACLQARHWQLQYSWPLRLAVNLSALQFNQPNLIEMVRQTLLQTNFSPACLELELTEGSLLQNIETSLTTMHQLKELGVGMAMDDFGTGYSSLNYLKRFPFDTLKIDQSFIRELGSDPKSQAITAAIIQMAHHLQLKIIAEGVETFEQLTFLKQLQCQEAQGYLFSRPLATAEFETYLNTNFAIRIA